MNQDDEISDSFQKVTMEETSTELNILLLGETGVGKSTFINSIANYIDFSNFEEAKNAGNWKVLIPTKFDFYDSNRKPHTLEIGNNSHENESLGNCGSSTQSARTYTILGEKNIRLIDTPGIADTRGMDKDKINIQNILSCLARYQRIHAICILLKPNVTRLSPSFLYCIKTILSQLDNSAASNIIFCFTNTRGSDYTPGDTLQCLQKIIDDIGQRQIQIPRKKNIFCFDNEGLKGLIAFSKGISISARVNSQLSDSWNESSQQFERMIEYIDRLPPHDVSKILRISEARNIIFRLQRPLIEISEHIQQNVNEMAKLKKEMDNRLLSLDELRKKLYICLKKIHINPLKDPALVCTNTKKCCEVLEEENGSKRYHYKERCHDPCFLKGFEPMQGLKGGEDLKTCINIKEEICDQCGCSYKFHMRIWYETFTHSEQDIDQNAVIHMNNENDNLKKQEETKKQLEVQIKELEKEQNCITEVNAKFAHFLQSTAITPFNDATEEYILHLIERERSFGPKANQDTINSLSKLYEQHVKLKTEFDKASKTGNFTLKDACIHELQEELYSLKHYGKELKECFDCQTISLEVDLEKIDYIHTPRRVFKTLTNFGKSIFKKFVGNEEQFGSSTLVVKKQEPNPRQVQNENEEDTLSFSTGNSADAMKKDN